MMSFYSDDEVSPIFPFTAKNSIFGYDFVHQPKRPKSNANVRAASSVEIHYIHKEDMNQILRMYPKFAKSFRETLNIGFDLNDEGEVGGMIFWTGIQMNLDPRLISFFP